MSYLEEYRRRAAQRQAEEGARDCDITGRRRTEIVPWWERELDLFRDIDDRQWKGRRVSSARDYLGGPMWDTYRPEKTGRGSMLGKLESAANEVNRLMNTVLNSADKKERVLSLAWSTGARPGQNSPADATILVSPDWIVGSTGRADKTDDPETIDALGGQVLLASTLKRTMNAVVFQQARVDSHPLCQARRILWEAAETAAGKAELLKDWPGFAPYLKRHAAKTTAALAAVQAFIDEEPDKMTRALIASAWSIVNPNQPLKLPPKLDKAVANVVDMMSSAAGSERYNSAVSAIEALLTEFEDDVTPPPQPPPPGGTGEGNPPPPGQGEGNENKEEKKPDGSDEEWTSPNGDDEEEEGGGDSDDEEEGEGENKEEEKKEGDGKEGPQPSEQPQPNPMPSCTDGTLFGQGVPSSHLDSSKLPENRTLVPTSMELQNYPRLPSGVGDCGQLRMKDSKGPGTPWRTFKQISDTAEPITKAAARALAFRANDASFPVHGLRSGDLDDGSLDKLMLNEDDPAVFERKEAVYRPEVAVGILVDESGSMREHDRVGQAQTVCVGLRNALVQMKGIKLSIYGHTQEDGSGTHTLREYVTDGKPKPDNLVFMEARGSNADGFAIMSVAKKLAEAYPSVRRRYLFVLSDGIPAARGFDKSGVLHVTVRR